MKEFEGINYEKEKRKKRLSQKNRKKAAGGHKLERLKRGVKQVWQEDRYLGNWELMNSR